VKKRQRLPNSSAGSGLQPPLRFSITFHLRWCDKPRRLVDVAFRAKARKVLMQNCDGRE
jgi:hypothetical protein